MSKTNFTNALNGLLDHKNISNDHLRNILGTNEVFIRKLRGGEVNLNLETMDKIAKKLGYVIRIEFEEV